jgi:hypothetical protein
MKKKVKHGIMGNVKYGKESWHPEKLVEELLVVKNMFILKPCKRE